VEADARRAHRAVLVKPGGQAYMQVEGMHDGEVFAPVARTATVWALLIHRAAEDVEIEQVDVKRRS
jgi:hypothetical protein